MDLLDLRSSLDEIPELNTKNLASTLCNVLDSAFKNQPITTGGKPLHAVPRSERDDGVELELDEFATFIDSAFNFWKLAEDRDARLGTGKIPVKLYSQVGIKVEKLVPTAPIHLGKSDNFI